MQTLLDNDFTVEEMRVLWTFIDEGDRLKSYKKVYGVDSKDAAIYKWFQSDRVKNKIIELGQSLEVYDTVCDKALLKIITNEVSADKDKINAVKTWNALRDRVHTTIKLDTVTKLDLSDIDTDSLEAIVLALTLKENDRSTGSTD